MNSFKRWLHSLILAFGVGALTLGCQVLFGEFKVRDGAAGGADGMGGGSANGGASVGGGSGPVEPSGPIVVFPTSDLYTSDRGAQAKFYVSLAKKPTALVNLPIASTDEAEGTVSPLSLTFTPVDWNAPQAVTVTGVRDPRLGNQPYAVNVGPATSDDPAFRGAKVAVPITNIDNDGPGIFVAPTSGLETTEAGGQAVFTVVLNSDPEADVVIALASSDETAGTVTPSSLKFTGDNWSAPQNVTVTGVDDNQEGNRPYQITVGPVTSTNGSYANLPAQTLTVTNLDNDQAGVMVTLRTGIDLSDTMRLRTSESGDNATFEVVLNNQPQKDVIIPVVSTSSEGTVSPTSLTFTHVNWAAPQRVTVVGVDNDSIADGSQPYQITLGPIASDDEAYGGLTRADLPPINVINSDNDQAEVTVTLLSGLDPNDPTALQTTEGGTAATFSIVLASKPKEPVQFVVTSTVPAEGKVSPGRVDFTVDNWNAAQVVTVTGVNYEMKKDGNVVYAVRISAPTTEDPAYQKVLPVDIKVKNLDEDVAGITQPKLLSGIDGAGQLVTTERGGSATFSVSLTSKPNDDVELRVTSNDPEEGKATPAMLRFTPANYAMAQVVTVTGQNDDGVDGHQPYIVTVGPSTSNDANYGGLSQTVRATNNDDDSAYIVVAPESSSGTTTENGGTASFGLKLSSRPTVGVTLTLVSSKEAEGKVAPASVMFTTANWATAQTVTVTGANDAIADGDQQYTVAVKGVSTDANYMYSATTLSLVNKDDDAVGLKITALPSLQTTEAGGKATFTVALTSQPTGNVNVSVSSSNTKEGTTAPASLTFTANNWATAQTVTVTGVDDSVADANQTYSVSLKTASSSADAKYAQLAASTVSLVNTNDDVVGITVTPTSCATTPGTTATFSVVLKSQPLGAVSVSLSSDTPAQGTVAPATLSFTAANWNTAQTVTVTGVDDGSIGVMTPYTIVTAAASSAMDASYNGINPADVACVNSTPIPDPDPPPEP